MSEVGGILLISQKEEKTSRKEKIMKVLIAFAIAMSFTTPVVGDDVTIEPIVTVTASVGVVA